MLGNFIVQTRTQQSLDTMAGSSSYDRNMSQQQTSLMFTPGFTNIKRCSLVLGLIFM